MGQSNRHSPAADAARIATVFAIPLVLILGLVVLKLASWRLYWRIAAVEDVPVEYLTGAVYLGTFIVALLASKEFFRTERSLLGALYAVPGAGCFFVAMEEISWGQRFLGIETPPALEEINHQGELNLHNIAGAGGSMQYIYSWGHMRLLRGSSSRGASRLGSRELWTTSYLRGGSCSTFSQRFSCTPITTI